MATVTGWNPYGVALNITATGGAVTRKSAKQFTVVVNASWETRWDGAKTNYAMVASSGGASVNLNTFGTSSAGGSGRFTGTYSINGYGAQTKTIIVTFINSNPEKSQSASKTVSFSVNVPAWPSYTVAYNANGGSGAPSVQTKWKDVALTLSSTNPTRTGYIFKGWGTTSTDTSVDFAPGASYTANASTTLYAIWERKKWQVRYNANGGSGAPSTQYKYYNETLKLSNTIPTKTNYTFKGWGTTSTDTAPAYHAGSNYTANANIDLYAIWSLSYVKPRIGAARIYRCDSNGSENDSGTYIKAEFDWFTDLEVTAITVEWKASSDTTYSSLSLSGSGLDGTIVTDPFGSGNIDPEKRYDVRITVSDSAGSTTINRVVPQMTILLDFLRAGRGVAIGKPAEAYDTLESAWPVQSVCDGRAFRHVHPVTGKRISYGVDFGGYHRGIYDDETATWMIDSDSVNNINITSTKEIRLEGTTIKVTSTKAGLSSREYGRNKVLWSGGYYMTADHTAVLSEAVSAQPNGIILVFSEYINGGISNTAFKCYFVPKEMVSRHGGTGHCIQMSSSNLAYYGTKYLYIHDAKIVGNDNNTLTGDSTSGIVRSYNRFVLRYVIGI